MAALLPEPCPRPGRRCGRRPARARNLDAIDDGTTQVLPDQATAAIRPPELAGAGGDDVSVAGAVASTSSSAQDGTAWDVAHAALYLASDEAGFVTGVCLPVDGGASARVG